MTRISQQEKSCKKSKEIRGGLGSCRLKVQKIQPINPKSMPYSQDKGHLSESKELWSELQLVLHYSAALICHQASAVTTEILLHHRLFCHQNQQAGVATHTGICTRMLRQATSVHAINQGQQQKLLNQR